MVFDRFILHEVAIQSHLKLTSSSVLIDKSIMTELQGTQHTVKQVKIGIRIKTIIQRKLSPNS